MFSPATVTNVLPTHCHDKDVNLWLIFFLAGKSGDHIIVMLRRWIVSLFRCDLTHVMPTVFDHINMGAKPVRLNDTKNYEVKKKQVRMKPKLVFVVWCLFVKNTASRKTTGRKGAGFFLLVEVAVGALRRDYISKGLPIFELLELKIDCPGSLPLFPSNPISMYLWYFSLRKAIRLECTQCNHSSSPSASGSNTLWV